MRYVTYPPDCAAMDKANEEVWAKYPHLKRHKLTMDKADDPYRVAWMEAYQKHCDDPKKRISYNDPGLAPGQLKSYCKPKRCKTTLLVEVVDLDNKPLSTACWITVGGLGRRLTLAGAVDFGEVEPRVYDISAEAHGFGSLEDPSAPAQTTKEIFECERAVARLVLEELPYVIQKENVIFVGSERDYDSFWLKMMFIAPTLLTANKSLNLRPADENTIAFVNKEYTSLETGALQQMTQNGFSVISVSNIDEVAAVINNRHYRHQHIVGDKPHIMKLQDVMFFCHGQPGRIALDFGALPGIDVDAKSLSLMERDTFIRSGRIFSYACRTGVGSFSERFSSDVDAKLDQSLAQKLANHFGVEVHAFLKRSYYGRVLREKSDSSRISSTLRNARRTAEGQVIQIPPEHEALPHPGLADDFWDTAEKKEGTNGYALWRKAGAIRIPERGNTPRGLSDGLHVFRPK